MLINKSHRMIDHSDRKIYRGIGVVNIQLIISPADNNNFMTK